MKGIHLEGLRVLGKPEEFARYYSETGADELMYADVVASLYGRNSILSLVTHTAREIHIPLTVGGGIRTLEDIRDVLRAGADKVSLNTAAVRRPQIIQEASRQFGSSTIVVTIEAIRQPDGSYEAFTDNGRESTGLDVFSWAIRVAELGAGEVIITSVDREGTGKGFDLELTRKVAQSLPIPVIACGGAGTSNDVVDVIAKGYADAVCLSSMLHYKAAIELNSSAHTYSEGNTEHLSKGAKYGRVSATSLPELKNYLVSHGVGSRNEPGVYIHA